jgi:dihydroorotase
VIVSSHDPQDVDTKRLPFSESADGAVGLETLLAAGLRLVHNGDVTLPRLIEAMSTAPARLLGIEAGTLGNGAPADFACSISRRPGCSTPRNCNRSRRTPPFDEARFSGKVIETVVAGNRVYNA